MRTECSKKAVGLDLILVLSTECLCLLNLSLRVHNHIGKENEASSTGSVADPDPQIREDPIIQTLR